MKKPQQGDKQERDCCMFHPFKYVISKLYNLSRTSSLKMLVLGKMLRYAEAIADIILYQDFC